VGRDPTGLRRCSFTWRMPGEVGRILPRLSLLALKMPCRDCLDIQFSRCKSRDPCHRFSTSIQARPTLAAALPLHRTSACLRLNSATPPPTGPADVHLGHGAESPAGLLQGDDVVALLVALIVALEFGGPRAISVNRDRIGKVWPQERQLSFSRPSSSIKVWIVI
jgi:hypothetical protein